MKIRLKSRVLSANGQELQSHPGIICFCHLRWNFVYQRPQHLLTRAQSLGDVHLWEEPLFEGRSAPHLDISLGRGGVQVLTPRLPHGMSTRDAEIAQKQLLDAYIADRGLEDFIAWYYTPMALLFSDHLLPQLTVYDCMDELSAFQGAPPELIEQEQRLFERADVVFVGGSSLYASKRSQHENVHCFPSSIDREHFAAAREPQPDPPDQAGIPHPRIGFFGVLDERLDRDLLDQVAEQHPEWHFVLIGPVVKIAEADLPHRPNLHYLGKKDYAELPGYLANWSVAMIPFAQNASTRFISPTKTPEYLAAGKPVVSTPIRDVVRPYGQAGLVRIAADAASFSTAIAACLAGAAPAWLERVDDFIARGSWDKTFEAMWREIDRCTAKRNSADKPPFATSERSAA